MSEDRIKGIEFQRGYWNDLARRGPDSVLDPFDSRGYKNQYLKVTRDGHIGEFASRMGDALILDLGCGSGAVTSLLERSGHRVVGGDISTEMLEMARARVEGSLVQIPGIELPFGANVFGAVITYGVLVYLCRDSDLARLLSEIHRVIAPGGRLLSFEQSTRKSMIVEAGLKRLRTVDEYEGMFAASGLNLISRKHTRGGHFPFLYPISAGLFGPRIWRQLSRLDALYARSALSRFDYRDTAFECEVG